MPARSLLAVFAHPDDEAFSSGGTLARYADAGVDVHLLCATRGEGGKITDPDIDWDADVAELREAELTHACEALGIPPPRFLGYHDSGRKERTRHDDSLALMNVDPFTLEADLRAHIAELHPEVMVTFDPHGVYGHVDHVVVHRAATAAFWSAGGVVARPPSRLYYVAMERARMKRMQAERPESPLARLDADLYGVGEADFAAILDVAAQRDRKEAAIRAHRSQVGPTSSFAARGEGDDPWKALLERETFTLGGLRGAFPAPPVADLYAGLPDSD